MNEVVFGGVAEPSFRAPTVRKTDGRNAKTTGETPDRLEPVFFAETQEETARPKSKSVRSTGSLGDEETKFDRDGAGFYLHIPYCKRKCAYCDFYSKTDCASIDRYVRELQSEIRALSARFPGRKIKTVYFGGGTPSLLAPGQVCEIVETIRENFKTDFREVTLEANPFSKPEFVAYRDAGVTRASVGVQSVNDATLQNVGRLHTAEEALRTLEAARSAGLRVSADRMLALPGEDETDTAAFLDAVLPYAEHVSAYLLKLEENTPLADKVKRGEAAVPDDERQAELYEYAVRELEARGFERYEISNFARRGAESAHNLLYWRMGEYFGAGAAAHSYLSGRRFYNAPDLAAYLSGFHAGNGKEVPEDVLSVSDRADEAVMLALRTREGLPLLWFENRFSVSFFTRYAKGFKRAEPYLNVENGRISIKKEYLLLENAILGEILQ